MTSETDTLLREAPNMLKGKPTIASFGNVVESIICTLELAQRISKTQALGVAHRRLVLGRLMLALRREQELSVLLKRRHRRIQFATGDSRETVEKQLADCRREAISFILNEASDLQLGVTDADVLIRMARTWDPNQDYFPVRA